MLHRILVGATVAVTGLSALLVLNHVFTKTQAEILILLLCVAYLLLDQHYERID